MATAPIGACGSIPSSSAEMTEVVCAVILDGHGKFLACRRAEGRHLAGKWEFPGGKVEPGETPRGALVREIREELGIEVKPGAALSPVVFSYEEKTIRLSPWLCRITAGSIQPRDHSAVRWCANRADWEPLDWAEADIPILRELEARPFHPERRV